MKKELVKYLFIMLLLSCMNANASLSVGSQVTINTVTHNTFVDSTTGNVWLNFANFFNKTLVQQRDMIAGSNYTVATKQEVDDMIIPLLDGTTLTWNTEVGDIIEGGSTSSNREGTVADWDDRYIGVQEGSTISSYTVFGYNGGAYGNVAMWAYSSYVPPIPTPPTTALLFLGSLALFANIRRRKQTPLISPTPLNTNAASA